MYNRKPHLFTYKDVLRIIKVVEPEKTPDKGLEEFLAARAALFQLQADILKMLELWAKSTRTLPWPRVIELWFRAGSFLRELRAAIPETLLAIGEANVVDLDTELEEEEEGEQDGEAVR